jgi:hypothetical protein
MEDFIQVTNGVLDKALCHRFIQIFNQSQHTKVGQTGGGVDTDKKRSLDVSIRQHPEFKAEYQALLPLISSQLLQYFEKYFFALIGPIGITVSDPQTGKPIKLTQENFERVGKPNLPKLIQYLFRIGDINAQKYQAKSGGYPYWHSEVYPQKGANEALHRVLLFMFYLNDVEEGGSTDFYYQNRNIQPKAGSMVIAPAYFTHTHRGAVPISNDKYILTSWVLFNQADKIYTP